MSQNVGGFHNAEWIGVLDLAPLEKTLPTNWQRREAQKM
jgi:hypothetical protein